MEVDPEEVSTSTFLNLKQLEDKETVMDNRSTIRFSITSGAKEVDFDPRVVRVNKNPVDDTYSEDSTPKSLKWEQLTFSVPSPISFIHLALRKAKDLIIRSRAASYIKKLYKHTKHGAQLVRFHLESQTLIKSNLNLQLLR